MVSTSSANAAGNSEPQWLTGLGQALDALPSVASAPQEPIVAPAAHNEDVLETGPAPARLVAVGTADVYDSVPPLKLTHRELQDYGACMSRAIATAQLDNRFVSASYLEKGFMGIAALGMMPREQRVQIHGETGMPTYGSWAQVNAQRDLARHTNPNDARFTRLHLSSPMSAHVRDLLRNVPDSPLNADPRIEVVELEGQKRLFRVHLDTWADPGFVIRTTLHIDPSKARRFDVAPLAQGKSGAWVMNRELNAMVGSLAKQGAAHLALVASKHCGHALTGVTQGIVGPVYFSGTVMPDEIADLFEIAPNNLVACFTAFELWREPRDAKNPPWIDPDDAPLERLQAQGWSAEVDKLWVCTPELRSTLEMYAEKYDTTLKVRVLY